ncbi:hypothetical protein C7974DRAFT_174199 [Boeremia exigua]|uniref:uncharacterized protein n=1 Tax=Boeremia exigua TaxID=749465 RepID=UPI001E8D1C24|nr:uncharacterized protein C7974DRAFT_174199 [Boeremia exigua]KAH6633552.1 hypothetical protein C7974DRAFT_174199 [Boeremia exigua]
MDRLLTQIKCLHDLPKQTQQSELLRICTTIDALPQVQDSRQPNAIPTPPELRIPVRAFVSTLPDIQYREQLEKEFERTLEYVQAQRKILKAVTEQNATLTAKTAYRWTSSCVPSDQHPSPLQALRLCYYMRSLGFETFASIRTYESQGFGFQTNILRLLVANPDSEKRGVTHDHLYWAQDITTGEVLTKAYKLRYRCLLMRSGFVTNSLALDIGPSFDAEGLRRQFSQQQGGSVQMRGGEAREHHRYILTVEQLEWLRADKRRWFEQRVQWVAEEAAVARAGRMLEARTSTSLVDEVIRHFQYSTGRYASPGEVMTATNPRADTWSSTEAGIYWPRSSRPRSHYQMLSPLGNRSCVRRNSV